MIWQRPARLIRNKADGVIVELDISNGFEEIRGDFGVCFGQTTQSYGSSCDKICVSFRFQHLKDKRQCFFRETAMSERFEHITAEPDYFVRTFTRVQWMLQGQVLKKLPIVIRKLFHQINSRSYFILRS